MPDRLPVHRPPLNPEGAAEYLGTTERHIRRLVQDRRIPFVKIGGLIRLLPDDLDAYVASQRVDAA